MKDVKQEFTQEQIEDRAKENNEMYFEALEKEEQGEIDNLPTDIHRPYRSE